MIPPQKRWYLILLIAKHHLKHFFLAQMTTLFLLLQNLSLAICSKKRLPVIIDTPLSRLDSIHRQAVVTVYFPKASDQTIILSTDSEINREYYNMMKNNIGDGFCSACIHLHMLPIQIRQSEGLFPPFPHMAGSIRHQQHMY